MDNQTRKEIVRAKLSNSKWIGLLKLNNGSLFHQVEVLKWDQKSETVLVSVGDNIFQFHEEEVDVME